MDCTVISPSGKATSLVSLWRSRRIVLCFLRQLGCRFCMQRTTKLMTIQDQLLKQGVKLVLVSLGTPLQAQKFIARTNFQGEMFVDPSSDGKVRTALSSQQAVAYNFFKLKRSVEVVRHPQVAALAQELDELGIGNWDDLMDSPETDEAGKTMEWAGDPFQVGGTFVLGVGNTCDYVYRSKFAGDHPPLAPLFEAATGKDMNGNDITPPAAAAWAVTLGLNKKYKKKEEAEDKDKDDKDKDDKDKDKDATNTRAVKQQHQLDTDRSNNNFNVWKVATAVAYGAVLVGTCAHLRTLIPFELEYLQQTPVVRHWPEFLLSQLLLGCAAALYTFFFTPTTQTTTVIDAPVPPVAPPVLAAPLPLDATATPSLFLGDHAVEFLKVSDIDQMLERQGFMDGIMNNEQLLSSMEMSTTPIVGISPVPQETSIVKAANPTCRARGDTWDATLGINEYAVILQYVRKFLAKTHHDIGRSGPVCPFVPKSLRKDALHLTVLRTGKGSATNKVKQDIENYLKPFAEEFLKMEPTTGSARAFKAVIFIFPDITLDQTTECIDGVQTSCKPYYVQRGLMLGEFHLRNNSPGLRNESFFPLRTPVPCLAVRHMVPTDLAFLDVSKYDIDLRISFLNSFLDVFGSDKVYKNYAEVIKAKEILAKAMQEK